MNTIPLPDLITPTEQTQDNMADKSHEDIWDAFKDKVNMAPKELEDWLDTEESKSVGASENGGESTGHKSGGKIVTIKRKKKADLTDADYDHMNKVVGYINRHKAQEPDEVAGSNWAYSLKNWGHDPTK